MNWRRFVYNIGVRRAGAASVLLIEMLFAVKSSITVTDYANPKETTALVVGVLTLIVIAWQAWETRRSVQQQQKAFNLLNTAFIVIDNWMSEQTTEHRQYKLKMRIRNGGSTAATVERVVFVDSDGDTIEEVPSGRMLIPNESWWLDAPLVRMTGLTETEISGYLVYTTISGRRRRKFSKIFVSGYDPENYFEDSDEPGAQDDDEYRDPRTSHA